MLGNAAVSCKTVPYLLGKGENGYVGRTGADVYAAAWELGGGALLDLLAEESHRYKAYGIETKAPNRFPVGWTPRTFQVVPEPFSEEDEMINSTVKMVRHRIAAAFGELLEFMYTDDGSTVHDDRNRKVRRDQYGLE